MEYLYQTFKKSFPNKRKNEKKKKRLSNPCYRPGQALRVPGGQGSQTSKNWHVKGVRLSALCTNRLYSPRKYS